MNTPNEFLSAALKYNAKGFSVIPVHPRSKAPIPTGWERYSTTLSTKEEIERWWTDRPNANIGFALGPASGTDGRYLFIVDQDVLKDANHVPILNEDGSFKQKGDISGCPATLSQTTGSGGKQFFYWAPLGYVIGNPKPRPLIDVKGLRGQVLVPPSIHPNGNSYAWDMDDLSRDSIAEFPQDALDALLGEKAPWASSSQEVLGGVPIGLGLRHMGIAQAAGHLLRGARTPEAIELARLSLYTWDKEKNKSPEPWEERKRELDNTFEGILAKEIAKSVKTPSQWNSPKPQSSKPVFASFADIQTEPIHWLWPGRIALGKLSLIVGDPNVGKSLLTASMAAIVSKGYEWPVDKTQSPTGDVILLSAEDDAGDTIKPRLEAAEANVRRVHSLQAIKDVNADGTQTERMFSLKRDLDALEEMLSTLPECKLVIVDPISAYLDDTDSHRNAAVRGLLGPLAALAARRKIAIVAIDHLNKNSDESNTLYRPGGSLAFVAAARAAYVVTRDKENPNRRLVVPIKNNIAAENTGLAYTVITAQNGSAVIVWEPEPIDVTAMDALTQPDTNEERNDTDWAVLFLEDLLANGRVLSSWVQKQAKAEHIGNKALRRAQSKLGIKPAKDKTIFNGPWWWALPGYEDAQGSQDVTNAEEEILGDAGNLGNPIEDSQDSQDAGPVADAIAEPATEQTDTAYKYITSTDELKEVLPFLVSSQKVALDTETTGLDPYACKTRLVQLATDEEVVIVDVDRVDVKELQPLFDSSVTIIGHNLKFDLQFLMHAGITVSDEITFFDTLLMDQILLGSRIPRSLKVVAEEYLGTVLDKTHQTAEWGGTLTPEMLAYAARDVAILLPLHSCISTILLATSLLEVAALENEALPFIVQLELAGVPIDSDKWRALTERAKTECTKLEAELNQTAGKSINWNSPKQVTGILKEQGVVVESTREDVLSSYSNHPLVSTLLKYRQQRKYLTTYGEKFLQHVQAETGRIHPNFRQIGADSGRMACSTPNMQNIPRNQEYRACIAPKDGRVLVKADYSQIELRIAAEISGDKRLIEAYKLGSDIHTLTAQLILGKETPTKEDRQAAKAINFGLLYGMGAPRLKEYAKNTYGVELTEGEAVRFRNKFFATYPGLRAWHLSQPEGFRTLKTLSGRKRFNVERFTEKLNTPVQGTGADGLKVALGILWKERAKFPTAQPVLVVHDEIVMECDVADALLVADWLKDCMKRGMERFVKLLPIEVEVGVAATWALPKPLL